MPKKSASNAAVAAVEEAAALFGVPFFRINSRVFTVPGRGGKERPMFMGQWKDADGKTHYSGMADVLLTPQVPVSRFQPPTALVHVPMNHNTTKGLPPVVKVTVALWVEAKSGTGRLKPEQEAFRDYVVSSGAYHIEAHDSADDVIEWFEKMGVKR